VPDLAAYGAELVPLEHASVAVIRLKTNWTPVGKGLFARSFHHGSLSFPPETLQRVGEVAAKVPTVVEIYADRPPVLGSVNDDAGAVLLSFGVSPGALADVLFGEHEMKGRLPFDLPRSDEAVANSRGDTPFDTVDPVYKFGHGLSYK
jgi:beta-glucosidase